MKWVELTSRRLGAVSRETVCVLPLGATEQHGPHLPLATDQIIADELAERLDDACDGQLLVLPGLPATCSRHHMAFPGTLTLEHESFTAVVKQLIESAAAHGFRRFFLLNAHGGNIAIGGVVAEQLSTSLPDAEIVFGTWFRMAGERLRHLVEGEYPAVGHACEFETSLIMAMRPELVDEDAIADDGAAPTSPLLKFDLLSGGPTVRSQPFEDFTASGVWGKPTKATPEKGRAILEIVVPLMKQILHAHWPTTPGLSEAESAANQGILRAASAGANNGAMTRKEATA
jgi:creatinine amidohydrolase